MKIDPRYFRPSEVDVLCGDASKARRELGWEPSVRFRELVRLMVDADRPAGNSDGVRDVAHALSDAS